MKTDAQLATEVSEAISKLETLGYRVMPPADVLESGARFQRMLDKVPEIPPDVGDDVPSLSESDVDSPQFKPSELEQFEAGKSERRNRWREALKAEVFLPRRPPRLKKDQEFTDPTSGKRWRVTDVGSRTFVAICVSDPEVVADPSWANGPPYAIVEHVWDETWYGVLRGVAGIEWDE